MRKHILALLAAGAAAFALVGTTLQAEASPIGGGWGAARAGGGWSGARFRGFHQGHRSRFRHGPVAAAEIGWGGGRYLSDSAWFLSDVGGYLADDRTYPDLEGYGYGYPAYSSAVSYGYHPRASYAVPVYGSAHVPRRVVTVHRGAPSRALHRAAYRPGRHVGR